MLVQLAIGDALGIAFEFVKDPASHGLVNNLTYQQNPRYLDLKPSAYTDDTLRSVATARAVLEALDNDPTTLFNPCTYAAAIQRIVAEDNRPGWSKRFQKYVEANLTVPPTMFIRGILAPAESNGSLMGCLPVSYLPHITDVKLAAAAQALATHSASTIPYAQMMALAAYYFLDDGIDREEMMAFVHEHTDGGDAVWHGFSYGMPGYSDPVDMSARSTAFAVLDLLTREEGTDTLSELARSAIEIGGDTDSVAALALGIASCCPTVYEDDLSKPLIDDLDGGKGFVFLNAIDSQLERIR